MSRPYITHTEYDSYTGTVVDQYSYEWTARDGSRVRTTVTVCDVGRSCDVAALASTTRRDLLQPEDVPHRDYRTERLERVQLQRRHQRFLAKLNRELARRD